MKIYDVLKRDHRVIHAYLNAIDAMGESKPKTRRAKFLELKAFLSSHAKAEEQVFYTPLKKHEQSEAIAREGTVEHAVATRLMDILTRMAPEHENWLAHFAVLKEAVEHHIEEEESEMFKDARKVLDSEDATRIGTSMDARREKLLKSA